MGRLQNGCGEPALVPAGAQGRLVPRAGRQPELAATCQFGGSYTELHPAIIREVNSRYDIDGVYMNGWPNFGVQQCYCETCRKIGRPDFPEYKKALTAATPAGGPARATSIRRPSRTVPIPRT